MTCSNNAALNRQTGLAGSGCRVGEGRILVDRSADDAVFAALADPTRRAMLDRLMDRPGLTLNDLVAGLDMRRQSATRHLKVLEGAGLISVQWQGREKRHFLNPLPITRIERRWLNKFSRVKAAALADLSERLSVGGENAEIKSPSEGEES